MKTRLCVISEYSKGRSFAEAVDILFRNGLMNGSYNRVRMIDRECARQFFRSCYYETIREAEVKYIIVETYDEEHEQWLIDYSAGVEVLPCL